MIYTQLLFKCFAIVSSRLLAIEQKVLFAIADYSRDMTIIGGQC